MGDLRRNVDKFQAMRSKGARNRSGRKDEDMLVVDLVVGRFGNHVAQIRILKDKDAVGLEQTLYAGRHAWQIGNVTHDIGGKHDVGAAMLGDDVFGELAIEEVADGADAAVSRDVRDVHRWLDAEMADTALLKMSQHDAVVAAEF